MENWIGNRGEDVLTIVGGDFNTRTGREGGRAMEIEEEERSKEKETV